MSEEKKYLGRAEVLGKPDLKHVEVYIPEWDGWIRLREMTAAERYKVAMSAKGVEDEPAAAMPMLVAACAVGPDDMPLFTAEELGHKNGRAIERLFIAAQKLNGLGTRFAETAAENFNGAESGDSPFNSAPRSAE